jgi:23S rRNA pseudouridine2604 synthase
MSQGVPILNTITKKCKVEKMGRYVFKIILIQGLNRQIRRMCEYLGFGVLSLKRTRVMNIELGDLPVGEWRYLNESEIRDLKSALEQSRNTPRNLKRS